MDIFIGSDESLKGDTFGGIVVAAVLVDEHLRKKLLDIGVTDSKKLTDKVIFMLAPEIRQICKYICVKELFPAEYNQYSLTTILNQLHTSCAEDLRIKYTLKNSDDDIHFTHTVDKYPGCTAGDVQEIGAEMLYPEVAAASILAREAAVLQLEKLSKTLGFTAPKGSTHVADALVKLKASGKDPSLFVKMHFRNVAEVFQK